MKKKINKDLIIATIFVCLIFLFSLINIGTLYKIMRENLPGQSINSFKGAGTKIEDTYRTTFKTRDQFLNVYGVAQLALNKKMIGNFEFIKDEQGFMHMFGGEIDTTIFNRDMIQLKEKLDRLNTPLLYVQIPSRELDNYTTFTTKLQLDTNDAMDSVINNLKENNINYIDIREKISNNEYPSGDIYLKTDIHLNTGTEFWILKQIIETLEYQQGIDFSNKEQIFDLANYSIVTKDMLGNLGRSAGKYFAGIDKFELYYPSFPTNYTVTNYTTGVVKKGEFWNTVMNGWDSKDYRTYWVVNYLQWPSPYYNIENVNVKDNDILIIMDSLGLRTTSYLSLLCNNVTILDSRYFKGVNYLDKALEKNKYDAVIILQSDNLISSPLFPNEYNSNIISENTPTEIIRGETYNVNITVENTGDSLWDEEKKIRLCIWQDGMDYGYRVNIPQGVTIEPGQKYTFVLQNFQAPISDETYLEYQMLQEGVTYFGEKQRVDIKVIN